MPNPTVGFFVVAMLCLGVASPVGAATKCVKLSANSACTQDVKEGGFAEWTSTCDGVKVRGIGFCSDQDGKTEFATSDTLSTASDPATADSTSNKYCWCRMISPAISQWVFYVDSYNGTYCDAACIYGCSEAIKNQAKFRAAIFSNLSN